MAICCCSGGTLLLLISAAPVAYMISLDRATWTSPHDLYYQSNGLLRECVKWDQQGGRFLLSTFLSGGLAEVSTVRSDGVLAERPVMVEPEMAGNVSLGLVVDRERNRVLVVFADLSFRRFAALGAYRLDTFDRLFLTQLSGPEDETSLADDVAVDGDGNAYVTDALRSKLWKVGSNGKLLSVIRSDVFSEKKERHHFVGLNGIVCHPNGYLLVVSTDDGVLFKVDISTEEASMVKIEGSIVGGDGLEMLSPNKIVVAATKPSARIVESSDDWKTAKVTEEFYGTYPNATSATVKDGKVYVSYVFGVGPKNRTHVLSEAVFSPVSRLMSAISSEWGPRIGPMSYPKRFSLR